MRINSIKDVEGFMRMVDSCVGRVELVTAEGDRLNLKSKLSQYVSMEKLFKDSSMKELEVIASEPEDVNRIINFLMDEKADS